MCCVSGVEVSMSRCLATGAVYHLLAGRRVGRGQCGTRGGGWLRRADGTCCCRAVVAYARGSRFYSDGCSVCDVFSVSRGVVLAGLVCAFGTVEVKLEA